MSYFQQGNNLPVPCDRLLVNPIQFRFDSPPFVPNIQCHQMLMGSLPYISAMCANEAASKCQLHPGRTFHFNQVSFNNYANEAFAMAVATAIDILSLGLHKQIYRTPEDGATESVVKAMSICCSMNFQTFPYLTSVTQPNIVTDAFKNIQAFQSLSNEVALFKNGIQNSSTIQQTTQLQMNPAFANNGFNNNNFAGNVSSNGNSGLFNSSKPAAPNSGAKTAFIDVDKYGYLKNDQGAKVMNNNKDLVVVNIPSQLSEVDMSRRPHGTEIIVVDTLVWYPSIEQQYPLTIDPRIHNHVVKQIEVNGVKCKISTVELKGKEEMDRIRHTILTMGNAYSSHIPHPFQSREEALNNEIEVLNSFSGEDIIKGRNIDETDDETNINSRIFKEEIKVHINPKYYFENFVEAAIFKGKLDQRLVLVSDVDCKAYRTYSIIAKPIISKTKHRNLLSIFSKAKNFKELSLLMKETIFTANGDLDIITVVQEVDALMTREINEVIRNRFSIPNLFIDSFVDDSDAIRDHFADRYGDLYVRGWFTFQKQFIQGALNTVDETKYSELAEDLGIIEDEDSGAFVDYITQCYSITHLNFVSGELGVRPYDECASAILESNNPVMYKLVKGLFEQEATLETPVQHHLIVASDGVIYEVYKGLIGNDFFTITKYK